MSNEEIILWQTALVRVMRRSIKRNPPLYKFAFYWYWSLNHVLNPMGFLRSNPDKEQKT